MTIAPQMLARIEKIAKTDEKSAALLLKSLLEKEQTQSSKDAETKEAGTKEASPIVQIAARWNRRFAPKIREELQQVDSSISQVIKGGPAKAPQIQNAIDSLMQIQSLVRHTLRALQDVSM